MTEIFRGQITEPAAWTVESSKNGEAFRRTLDSSELSALRRFLQDTRHFAPQDTKSEHFNLPELQDLIRDAKRQLFDRLGVIVISGIEPGSFTEEEMQRVYWGLGTQLGNAAVQSVSGDRLGFVESDPSNMVARGYKTDAELEVHTDSYEVVGLMCIRPAESGGESRLTSALSIHNVIEQTKPELLPPLYEGYYMSMQEGKFSKVHGPGKKLPVFSCRDGKVSCNFNKNFYYKAAEDRGEKLPEELSKALDYFSEVANRPDLNLEFMLKPGEIMLFHNFQSLHARRSFIDSEANRRLLLRLWLNVPDGRPMVPEMYERGKFYDRVQQEKRAQAAT